MGVGEDKAARARQQLQRKIDAAVVQAWDQGLDFMHGPLEFEQPDHFQLQNIFAPLVYSVQVKGGPVDAGSAVPVGWTLYKRPHDHLPQSGKTR